MIITSPIRRTNSGYILLVLVTNNHITHNNEASRLAKTKSMEAHTKLNVCIHYQDIVLMNQV